jgi:hypothetical protein
MAPSSKTAGAGIRLILYRLLLEQALTKSTNTSRQISPGRVGENRNFIFRAIDLMMACPYLRDQ